jgi:hypothetical protein
MSSEIRCGTCGARISTVQTKFGNRGICSRPGCDIRVNGYGIQSDKETRELRKDCHLLFDSVWKRKLMSRKEAYVWLASVLEIDPEEAHFGKMDKERLEAALNLTVEKLKELLKQRELEIEEEKWDIVRMPEDDFLDPFWD